MPAAHLELSPEHFPGMKAIALIRQTQSMPDKICLTLVIQPLKFRKNMDQTPFRIYLLRREGHNTENTCVYKPNSIIHEH